MRSWQDAGPWILRVATVLILVSSSIRYFGTSSRSDTIGWWVFLVAVAVGLVGLVLDVAARWRRRSDRDESASAQPVAEENRGSTGHPGDHHDG